MIDAVIKVMIVDDHAVVRHGIQAVLEVEDGFEVVGSTDDGEEAANWAERRSPDVALVDLLMPRMGGVETCRRIKAAAPEVRIALLTSYDGGEHILEATRAGALSYLLKDMAPGELRRALRRTAAGEPVLHAKVAGWLMRALAEPKPASTPFDDLSGREREVLELVADGLNNLRISRRLGISEKTVKAHVSNLLFKLNLADRTQAAVMAWRGGLKRP